MNNLSKAGIAALMLGAIVATGGVRPVAASSGEATFLGQLSSEMNTMMAAMNVKSTGNIDKDFVAMMVPHHQGAIAMAESELQYGHNKKLQAIAQEIIVTQQQEIAAMRFAVGEPLPPSAPAPDQIP